MVSILLTYSAVGAVAGVLAGLLGIGGGLVIVPMLVFCFTWQGLPDELMMHLALGTSMASIIFTAVSSFWAHHKRGAVHWIVVRRIVLGIFVGTFLGSCFAARLSTGVLKGFFVVFLYYVASQMLLGRKPKPSRQLPGKLGMFGVGNVIGAVSRLVGIGGGSICITRETKGIGRNRFLADGTSKVYQLDGATFEANSAEAELLAEFMAFARRKVRAA